MRTFNLLSAVWQEIAGWTYNYRFSNQGLWLTDGDPKQFITILELPLVTDAQSAVNVGVSYQIKKATGK
jgi:hypothetical protein